MDLASVLIAVLPVLLVAALVLCYVCVLRRLCCDADPRQGAGASGSGTGGSVGGVGSVGLNGGANAPSTTRSSWCWWGDAQQHEELQLTNTTHLDSQAAASAS